MSLWKALGAVLVAAGIVIATCWTLVAIVGVQASLLWAGLAAIVAWAVRSNIEKKREHQRLLADHKREQYTQLLTFVNEFLPIAGDSGATEGPLSPKQLREFRLWSLRLTMTGSDDVVGAWNRAFRTPSDDNSDVRTIFAWGELFLAMRRDAGNFDTKLTTHDILTTFVNDLPPADTKTP